MTEMTITPGYDATTGVPAQVQQHYTDGAQHVVQESGTDEEVQSLALQQTSMLETFTAILVELRTITFYLQAGLGVADDPDSVRCDITNSINQE